MLELPFTEFKQVIERAYFGGEVGDIEYLVLDMLNLVIQVEIYICWLSTINQLLEICI